MNVTYKRELDHNYLVLDQEEFQENYQVGMLVKNRIPGLLECRVSRLDTGAAFYYEITSRQSLRLVLERKRLSQQELLKLLEGILRAAQSCEEYLLDTDRLLLTPDHIYLEPDDWTVFFCFCPFGDGETGGGLPGLAEYLLDHLDRQDSGAVTLGYEFYRMAGEENPSLRRLLDAWKEGKGQEEGEKESVPETREAQRIAESFPEWKESAEGGTVCLKGVKDPGLFLRSQSASYPDFRITKESFLIGKKKDAVDGLLKARGISRIHGRISREEDCYYLTDLNSTNGTFLNGGRLELHEKARLRPGDCVGFADVRYIVEG